MKSINILFVTHCTSMAGANRSMVQLIEELRMNYGCRCSVLLPSGRTQSDGDKLQLFLQKYEIPYQEADIRYFVTNNDSIQSRLDFLKSIREMDDLCKKLAPMHFNIIHSNSSVIDFGGYLSIKLGVRHVWHLREFGYLDYGLKSMFGNLYQKWTYKNGDVFIAISNVIKKHYLSIIPDQKIRTIYNGISVSHHEHLANHRDSIIQFFCAGLLMECKNQKEIVYAINELVNARGIKDLHLTLVGRNVSQYADEILVYIKQKQLSNYITIFDEVDGIADIAEKMDVGITPSVCEAFGRTTVEYMMQNLAVIANDSGANSEILENGISGLIYKSGDYVELADCMQRVIEDKSLLISLAVKGRNRALERFQSKFNTEAIFRLYQEILESTINKERSYMFIFRTFLWVKAIIPFKFGRLLCKMQSI